MYFITGGLLHKIEELEDLNDFDGFEGVLESTYDEAVKEAKRQRERIHRQKAALERFRNN